MKDQFIKILTVLQKMIVGERTEVSENEPSMGWQKMEEIKARCFDEKFLSRKFQEYSRYATNEAYRKFLKQVHPGRKKRWFLGIGTAAAIIILLIGIREGWQKIRPAQMIPTVPATVENTQIEPGGKKAMLKLADGSVVNVGRDSMQIEEKTGARIAYMNGELAYKTTAQIEKLVYNELIVPIAGECYLLLEDGTKVWMNADSKLKYPVKFVGKERRVYLEGEAYFDVVRNEKPFLVSTKLGEIEVLGTSFDVKAYRGEEKMYTTLVSGKVRFQGTESMEIAPGEQIVATVNGQVEKRTVNVDEFIGWKNGVYVFKEQPLEAIMTDLSRWYNVSVFYQNPAMKQITFTGNLQRYDRIGVFMEILQRTGDVKYKISGNTVMLYK